MRSFLLRFVKYALVAAAAYALFALLVGNLGLENRVPNTLNLTGEFDRSLLRFREAETAEPVDMVFLGSSHTYRGFDPRIMADANVAAFNLGSSAQTPLNSHRLLQRYIGNLQPQVVVLEMYWGVFESTDGSEASINIACNAPASLDFLAMTLQSKDVRTVNSVLTNYASRIRFPLETAKQIDYGNDVYVMGGYSETHRKSTAAQEVKKLKPYTSSIAPIQLHYLDKIRVLCEENNATLVLVRTPVTTEYFNALSNLNEVTEPMLQYAAAHQLVFHDFNEDVQQGTLQLQTGRDFYDKNHLGQSGVDRFNAHFISFLRQHALLPEPAAN